MKARELTGIHCSANRVSRKHERTANARAFALSLTLLLCTTVALAQGTNPYDGSWRAQFETDKGETREGDVTIKGQGGSWDFLHQVRGNPCAGRAYPLTVQSAAAEELVVAIERAKSLAGCKDGTAKFKWISDTVLDGEFVIVRRWPFLPDAATVGSIRPNAHPLGGVR